MSEQSKADTLLIVDAQIGLLRGEFDVSQPESVIANASTALDRARSRGANVVYVMHVGDLSSAEVVRYHNAVLEDLGSDDAVIVVKDSDQVEFG